MSLADFTFLQHFSYVSFILNRNHSLKKVFSDQIPLKEKFPHVFLPKNDVDQIIFKNV